MTDRTIVALLGGLAGGVVILVATWIIVSAYQMIGWQIPVASGVAVFVAVWTIDFLSDYMAKRNR